MQPNLINVCQYFFFLANPCLSFIQTFSSSLCIHCFTHATQIQYKFYASHNSLLPIQFKMSGSQNVNIDTYMLCCLTLLFILRALFFGKLKKAYFVSYEIFCRKYGTYLFKTHFKHILQLFGEHSQNNFPMLIHLFLQRIHLPVIFHLLLVVYITLSNHYIPHTAKEVKVFSPW